MTRMKTFLTCGAALAAFAVAPAHANLLVNGGFESPAVITSAYNAYSGGDSFGGWNVTGPGASVLQLSTTYVEPNITFGAQAGLASADLSGIGNVGPTAGLNQSVATIAGKRYALSFWVGNADGTGNSKYLLPSTVNLSINGGGQLSFTNSDTTPFRNNWKLFNTSFIATGASTNIAFLNGTGLGDAETGLDSVSLSAVPEPASWALMIAGFGLTGAAMRRRRGNVRVLA